MKISEIEDYIHIEFEYNEKLEIENKRLREEVKRLNMLLEDSLNLNDELLLTIKEYKTVVDEIVKKIKRK